MKKIIISWEQYGNLINKLIQKIKNSKLKFNSVYGIKRGGWPIAVAISHAFNVPIAVYPTEKTIVVDDINDYGKTLAKITRKAGIACLHSTDWSKTEIDIFVDKKLDKDDWIIYPYEVIDIDKEQTTLEEFG